MYKRFFEWLGMLRHIVTIIEDLQRKQRDTDVLIRSAALEISDLKTEIAKITESLEAISKFAALVQTRSEALSLQALSQSDESLQQFKTLDEIEASIVEFETLRMSLELSSVIGSAEIVEYNLNLANINNNLNELYEQRRKLTR